jgi:A/G-specific adenine glycosylase
MEEQYLFFRKNLLAWASQSLRPMPWKGERDPYKIWLSEIILQQTRVEQGMPYYERFVAHYPTVQVLAEAPEDQLFKLWEGLGYYSRARNLHATAKYIAFECDGKFPDTWESIRALKGVGDYTAAAIASFAYDLPYAVLDGNVYRVLARFFGIETPTDTPAAKKAFTQLAQAVLDPTQPGVFNQAMMDFGATHCTPQQPQCAHCPLQAHCGAYRLDKVASIPLRAKKAAKKERFFLYAVFDFQGQTLVRKRGSKDIWKGLYEFPMLELSAAPEDQQAIRDAILKHFFPAGAPKTVETRHISTVYRQTLTHQLVSAWFSTLYLSPATDVSVFETAPLQDTQWVARKEVEESLAVPRVVAWYLAEKSPALTLF